MEKIELNIGDLANIKNILDVAIDRGSFKGKELQVVGATYDKLEDFITQNTPEQNSEVEETEETE